MVLETISSLKIPAKIREYRKSEFIFDEGTTGVEMFIIPGHDRSGRVLRGDGRDRFLLPDRHGRCGRGRHETRCAEPEKVPGDHTRASRVCHDDHAAPQPVKDLVFPYLERLRNSKLDAQQKECLSVIESLKAHLLSLSREA